MENVIKIRPGSSQDQEVIVDFQMRCAFETDDRAFDIREVSSGVSRILSTPELGEYFVAEIDNQIAGCCLLQRQFSDWNNCFYLWVESVYVMPEYRGLGVLQSMYSRIEVISRKDVKELRSTITETNTSMHRAVKKAGWESSGYVVFSKTINTDKQKAQTSTERQAEQLARILVERARQSRQEGNEDAARCFEEIADRMLKKAKQDSDGYRGLAN